MQVCVVDEISMVGADKIYDMSRRLCEIIISEDLYANKGTLFVGDPMQVNDAQFKFFKNSFSLFFISSSLHVMLDILSRSLITCKTKHCGTLMKVFGIALIQWYSRSTIDKVKAIHGQTA